MTASLDLTCPRRLDPTQLTGDQLASLHSLLMTALVEHRWRLEQDEELIDALDRRCRGTRVATTGELARTAADRSRDALEDVERALGRIDDGTYGTCEACGRQIPFERLEAIPHTRSCVACQR